MLALMLPQASPSFIAAARSWLNAPDRALRIVAAMYLWVHGPDPERMAKLLSDSTRLGPVRGGEFDDDAEVVGYVAELVRKRGISMSSTERRRHIAALRYYGAYMERANGRGIPAVWNEYSQEPVREAQEYLSLLQRADALGPVREQFARPLIAWGAGLTFYLLAMLAFWNVALRVRPLAVLRLGEMLDEKFTITLPKQLGGFSLPLHVLTLLRFFTYHPRALNGWVVAHREVARERFMKQETVRRRQAYVPIPCELDGRPIVELRGTDFRHVFHRKNCLLIFGEGGGGKTTLACQIAEWTLSSDPTDWPSSVPMLPLLVEDDFPVSESGERPRLEEVLLYRLTDLIGGAQITVQLMDRLLREGRVLLIADSLSERDEVTRRALMPSRPGFPVKVCVVTSRHREPLGGIGHAVLTNKRIEGAAILSFLERYLARRHADSGSGSRLMRRCAELFDLVGDQEITPLFATMYAEIMIGEDSGQAPLHAPEDLPSLVLEYLNVINRAATPGQPDDRELHADAKRIAWCMMFRDFRPRTVLRTEVLSAIGGECAEDRLTDYERRLGLIQTVGSARDSIRFVLDPVSEHLAAMHAVETSAHSAVAWQALIRRLSEYSLHDIHGFVAALSACTASERYRVLIPADFHSMLQTMTTADSALTRPQPSDGGRIQSGTRDSQVLS
jgi:hypothetical protein